MSRFKSWVSTHSTQIVRPQLLAALGGSVATLIIGIYWTKPFWVLAVILLFAFSVTSATTAVVSRVLTGASPYYALVPYGIVIAVSNSIGSFAVRRWLTLLWPEIAVDLSTVLIMAAGIFIGLRIARALSPLTAGTSGNSVESERTAPPSKESFQAQKLAFIAEQFKDTELKGVDLMKRLETMITYAVGRVDYYEDMRNRYVAIGLALLTGAIALAGFLAKSFNDVPAIAALLILAGIFDLLGTGFWLIWEYNRTNTPKYVYRSIVDIRSWIYFYNLRAGSSKLESRDQRLLAEQQTDVAAHFNRFLSRWTDYAKTPFAFLAEDLEQVFILQFIQQFKRESAQDLQSGLTRGIKVLVVLTILTVFCWVVAALLAPV